MAKASKRPMTLVLMSGEADRIHMALMMGATAAAVGRPVTFFFSKNAIRFLQVDGWAKLASVSGQTGPEMDEALMAKGIADSTVLLDGLGALDARFIVCETALREHDIDTAVLVSRPAVEISGLVDILEKGAGGDWLTF